MKVDPMRPSCVLPYHICQLQIMWPKSKIYYLKFPPILWLGMATPMWLRCGPHVLPYHISARGASSMPHVAQKSTLYFALFTSGVKQQKKMTRSCCAVNCRNRKKNRCKLYILRDSHPFAKRRLWLQAIKRVDWGLKGPKVGHQAKITCSTG